MFVDVRNFAFTSLLEENWVSIRSDLESVPPDRFIYWPETALYDFGWRAFPLVALEQTISANTLRCPKTVQLLASIPSLVNAGFSLFEAGTRVHPHVGYTSSVLRFHLGLKIPEGCGLRVGNEARHWEEGKLLGFDDMVEHSAWNNSEDDRVILLFDVLKPGAQLEVTPSALQAVQDYLDRLRATDSRGAKHA